MKFLAAVVGDLREQKNLRQDKKMKPLHLGNNFFWVRPEIFYERARRDVFCKRSLAPRNIFCRAGVLDCPTDAPPGTSYHLLNKQLDTFGAIRIDARGQPPGAGFTPQRPLKAMAKA